MVAFRRAIVIFVTGSLSYAGAAVAQAGPGDPPGRVGRLAFLQGTVSFHDNEQTDWAPALVNTPVTGGDAIWTEPNARSEISIAGTRLRMDSATQLEMLALDDTQTRMQLDQGRIDIKTFTYDTRQPYEIVTPRGIVSLQQQGDYYVEAGTTDDPTRLGVRQGAAQIQASDGQVLAVRAGEVGEISGDGSAPQLHTIRTAPPPMPASWADRDRQIAYGKPPQYLGAGVTGYEDLNAYGSWTNDPEYGQVWSPRSVPAGWAPYRTGRWNYEQTYGWTWVDEQPWGFAPYHYGRWAQRNDRWYWVPPQRQQRAVYAPALVAFVGGTELGAVLGQQSRAPVGWFPLGPREAYVPPYTDDRDYYRRLNASARVQQQVLDERWRRAQRREAIADDRRHQLALMNRRYATVVPAEDFARSRPVERVALKVAPDKIATAPVALFAAPPSPTHSIRAARAPDSNDRAARPNDSRPNDPRRDANDRRRGDTDDRRNPPSQSRNAGAPAHLANLQAIKPEPEREKAPGPKFERRPTVTADKAEPGKIREPSKDDERAKTAAPLPKLVPRNASAPPAPKIEGERKPAVEANRPTNPPRPGEANRPEPQRAEPPGQANLPPVRDRSEHRPQAPRTENAHRDNEPDRVQPRGPAQREQASKPAREDKADKNDRRPDAPQTGDAQRHDGPNRAEPNRPAQREQASRPTEGDKADKNDRRPEAPRIGDAQRHGEPNRAEPQRSGEPSKPPQRGGDAAKPTGQAAPQAAKPAEPPKSAPAPRAPHQAAPPAPAQQRERETRTAPRSQPHQARPSQQQTRQAAPPVRHAAPPVQHAAPAQRAAPPQQAHAPRAQRPAPPQQQAKKPSPAPSQASRSAPAPHKAQAPRRSPAPQHNEQAQAPPHDKK